jgi:hypothetical protein
VAVGFTKQQSAANDICCGNLRRSPRSFRCRGRDPADKSTGVCARRSGADVAKGDYDDAVNWGAVVVVDLLDTFLDIDVAPDDEPADAVDAGRHNRYVSALVIAPGTADRSHDRDVAAARGYDDNTLTI